jgi:xanthine dehydrogenase YagR molybdenum-binding subunit
MKFDTPATTNPIDQLKVVGRPTDRIDGPLKTSGTARYAYERHDVAPDAAYGYIVGAGIAKGEIARWTCRPRARRPASSRSSPRAAPASSARASSTPRSCSAGRRSSTTTRRSRWSSEDLRAGARRAQLVRVTYARSRAASTSPR